MVAVDAARAHRRELNHMDINHRFEGEAPCYLHNLDDSMREALFQVVDCAGKSGSQIHILDSADKFWGLGF